jgi:hypothetical protein
MTKGRRIVRFRKSVAWPTIVAPAIAVMILGCGQKTLPNELVGTYKRPGIEGFGMKKTYVKELNVTANGLTVGSDSAPIKKVKCDSNTSCSFETSNECTGTISKQPTGDIVLTATFVCESMGGKWLTEDNAKTELAKLEADVAKQNVDEKKRVDDAKAAWASAGSTASTGGGGTACAAQCLADLAKCKKGCSSDSLTDPCQAQCSADGVKCTDRCK